jgi:hypothetical protein
MHLPDFLRSKMVPFNGVGFTTHPRGGRLGNFDWQLPGSGPPCSLMERSTTTPAALAAGQSNWHFPDLLVRLNTPPTIGLRLVVIHR